MIDNIHDDVFITRYVVFIRDSQTGFWKVVKRFKPAYKYESFNEDKRWFFFWTKKVTVKKIVNSESWARTQARIEAVKEAVLLRASGHDVKVHRVEEDQWMGETFEYSHLIWKNGEWADA